MAGTAGLVVGELLDARLYASLTDAGVTADEQLGAIRRGALAEPAVLEVDGQPRVAQLIGELARRHRHALVRVGVDRGVGLVLDRRQAV
jgi:hypothetical protein